MGSRRPPPIRSIVASVLQVSFLLLLLLAEATVQKGLRVCSERVLQTGAHTYTASSAWKMHLECGTCVSLDKGLAHFILCYLPGTPDMHLAQSSWQQRIRRPMPRR